MNSMTSASISWNWNGAASAIPSNALDGAAAITAKKYLPEEITKLTKDDSKLFAKLRMEVEEKAEASDKVEE